LDEDQEPPPGLARAAAGQPSVVRSPVGPLHRVSTWSLILRPADDRAPGSLSA